MSVLWVKHLATMPFQEISPFPAWQLLRILLVGGPQEWSTWKLILSTGTLLEMLITGN